MNSSLNHIFRSIWSDALGTWIAVSEIAKAKGKRSVSGLVRALREELSAVDSGIHQALGLKPILLALLCCFSSSALANPTGGAVANGQASFSTSGNTLTVTNTPGTIINWQDFSIQSGEVTRFAQQSAASTVLNRVVTSNPSSILGSLQSNGRVFLVNPNGIVFGQGATIDVAGMVATTLKLSDTDFLAGRNNFSEQAGAQSISNAGNITAESGGQIYLIAPNVENTGIINAPNGEILLAAGHSVELVDSSNPNLRVNITAPAGEATNVGQLVASAGNLGLFGTVVKNSGTVSASSATLQGGKIVFKASQRVEAGGTISAQGAGGGSIEVLADMQNGTVDVSGTLDASAPISGNGGFIETSAAHVNIADSVKVSTAAAMGLAGTWLIDPFDFTIAATGGNMSGATLSSSLAGGNVSILSTSGTTGTLGDVNVNDTVSWSANKLTLNAQNNININTSMNASGTASLALEYGQISDSGGSSNYFLNNGAQINLPAGSNFSTKLGLSGALKNYTVITTLGAEGSITGSDLQGINGGLAGNYVLGSNIDATATSAWNSGAGFEPIGKPATLIFAGSFDGLGHTITNLTIYRPAADGVGLFGYVDIGSVFRNVGLLNASVSGGSNVGGLLGYNQNGLVSNSYATGTVSGTRWVGGLVGYNFASAPGLATISNSYASTSVSATGSPGNHVGGLVGNNDGGLISNSYATGSVSGVLWVGGLVGYNFGSATVVGTISNSYATGNVTNTGTGVNGYVGGLLGYNDGGLVSGSYAKGTVSGNGWVGGLVGYNRANANVVATITKSYATGNVTDSGINGYSGGLVGYNDDGMISASYASGNVSGYAYVGGLVGYNLDNTLTAVGTIINSYATGNVTSSYVEFNYAGGLVGYNRGNVSNSYASGSVTGTVSYVGGLVGFNDALGTVTNSYASGSVSGAVSNIGVLVGLNDPMGTITSSASLSNTAMMSQASFSGFDFANTWVMYEGYTAPLLRSFMKALTVTANNATKTYDGLAYSNSNALSYSITPNANLLGTASYTSGTNAGSYVLTPGGLYSNQQGYIITYVNGALTINQAALSVSASNAIKTYNGLVYNGGNGVVYSGLVNGETSAVLGGTLTYGGTAQGASNAGSYIISSGGLTSGNYAISYTNGTLTINPSLTSTWNGSASYDWNDAANWNGYFTPQAGADVTIGVLAGVITFSSGSATINTLNSGTSLALNGGSFTLGNSLADASVISGANLEVNGAALTLNGSLTANTLSLISGSVGGTGNLTVATNYSQQVAGTLGSTFNQLSLRSIGDFNLMQAYAATGGITINSGGKIVAAASGVNSHLTANNVRLTAVTGIGGATAPVKLVANNISASTTNGEIALTNAPTAAVTLSSLTTGDASAVSYKQDGQALNLTGSVASAGGSILIDPPTDLIMSTTASINSNGGAIDLQASGNMALATVNAGSGAVSIASSGGNITSALPDGQNNITASTLTARAATGIQFAYKAQSVDIRSTGGTVLALNTLTGGYSSNSQPTALQEIMNVVSSDAFAATGPAVDPDAAEDEEGDDQVVVNAEETSVDSSANAAEKSLPVCQ